MEASNEKSFEPNSSWKISTEPCNAKHAPKNTGILEHMISIYFSKCKPFRYENRNTEWWKINNHHLLKKILFQCSVPGIIPSGMSLNNSYYIYGYYIAGITNGNESSTFIYGIPALYGIDEKPYFINCCWKSENNTGELYGEFGYWLIENEILL
ncbi:MAG: hypothetical protein ACM3UU_05555 [Ignavibacteriales bacterium]